MAAPVSKRSINSIKDKLLRPSLTSHFICDFPLPHGDGVDRAEDEQDLQFSINLPDRADRMQLLCTDASLPGASLMTHEINNDYTGVTERHAYRRSFDDRADFTFIVDHDYLPIKYFQMWINYISDEKRSEFEEAGPNYNAGYESLAYNYRMRYPKDYMTNRMTITKFEKDSQIEPITYQFYNAFPISINSMPVSYEASNVLKCTVSFTYSRYVFRTVEKLPTVPAERIVGRVELSDGTFLTEYLDSRGQIRSAITTK